MLLFTNGRLAKEGKAGAGLKGPVEQFVAAYDVCPAAQSEKLSHGTAEGGTSTAAQRHRRESTLSAYLAQVLLSGEMAAGNVCAAALVALMFSLTAASAAPTVTKGWASASMLATRLAFLLLPRHKVLPVCLRKRWPCPMLGTHGCEECGRILERPGGSGSATDTHRC